MKKTINFTGWSVRKVLTPPLLKTIATSRNADCGPLKGKYIVINLFWLPVLLLLSPGCISLYYAPNSQNIPMFKEKNETEASLAFQFGTIAVGCDADFAYSFTNHFGMMVNYNHWTARKRTGVFDDVQMTGKSDIIEVGAGYYLPFQEKFVFEAYGGGGWGGVKNVYFSGLVSKLNYNRYYVQPSCGYYNKKVNLIFSLRLSAIDYTRIKYDPGIDESDKYDLEYIIDYPFSFYIEPAFTFRVGGENLKFQLQVVYSYNLNTPELVYDPLCANVGLIVLFPNKKDKTKNQFEQK